MTTSKDQLSENEEVQNYMNENPRATISDSIEHVFGSSFQDPETAFEQALKQGVLSKDIKLDNYVENYMYMYSKNDVDFFKHKDTRCYVTSKPSILV